MQESLKITTKDITGDFKNTFNQIYHEIIGICKAGSKYYMFEPLKREWFNFTKILANMGTTRRATVAEPATVTT
jgi:hypothetical protein